MSVAPSPLKPYLRAVGETLKAALCILDIPSPIVERQNRPEVEVREMGPNAMCQPLYISRDENERCLIEVSVNSVRASFCFRKYSDEVERALVRKYTQFVTQRASSTLDILRKKPLAGWDVSFLFTANDSILAVDGADVVLSCVTDRRSSTDHALVGGGAAACSGGAGLGSGGGGVVAGGKEEEVLSLKGQSRDQLITFLLSFLEDFDRDVKDMKLNLNTRLRSAAAAYIGWAAQ